MENNKMMYVFICPDCGHVRMVSAVRELLCVKCKNNMANCELSFTEWVGLKKAQRDKIVYIYKNADREKLCFFRPMPHYDPRERGYW